MINQTCPLILKDLYSYDIQSCYATLLSKQQFDFGDIDLENKSERNIFIGTKQRDNKVLADFLLQSTENLVKFYLQDNNIADEDVIVSQRDGFIIKKMLKNTDEFIEMKFRGFIDFLVISTDRKKFFYCSEGKITVRGVPNFYPEMEKVFQLFASLNFCQKKILFRQLDEIKKTILLCDNISIFLIPLEDKSAVVTHKGTISVSDPSIVSAHSIDRLKYYNHYLKDFMQSIFLECY